MTDRYLLARAVRGPIVLIALGLLFLLHQQDELSFQRSWPILFIIFGVLKLIERLFAPPLSVPPPWTPAPGAPQSPPPQPWNSPGQGGFRS